MIYDALIAPFTEFEFMRRALAAVIALSLGGAPIGVFLMLRRMSLVGDAMAHAILPGAAIGFLLSAPLSGILSDRFGAKAFTVGGDNGSARGVWELSLPDAADPSKTDTYQYGVDFKLGSFGGIWIWHMHLYRAPDSAPPPPSAFCHVSPPNAY